MTDHRTSIASNLRAFTSPQLRQASLDLLATLGYQSDKTTELEGSKPQAFLDFIKQHNPAAPFNEEKALVADWQLADLLFQLTDDEISGEHSLFKDTNIKRGLLRSYLFFAIELTGSDYARGKLTAIARQLNRAFPMPVMVLIKHLADKQPVLSIAVINRRRNKTQADKDVLEKTTIIRDISLTEPHRGHLDILNDLAFDNLVHPQKLPINNFDTLHTAWEQIFNVELLNKNFYDELANWFFWAKKHIRFPLYDEAANNYDFSYGSEKAKEHATKNLIRLLTRTLFVWFIKERELVPGPFFNPCDLKKTILKSFDPESKDTNYYKAVLQNLFFATLNQTHGEREFRKEGRQHQNTTTLLRYKDSLSSPVNFVQALEDSTPFLNGGLFECLDHPHPTKKGPQGGKVIVYEDGFSDRKDNPLLLPDFLFFGKPRTEDLSGEDSFGLANKHNAKVRGLIHILNNYKFTIVENTPIDQEIALDPELLGQVFENLLASYNPETKTTARKQTGSFYTPRPIVDYMVDESLKAHFTRVLVEKTDMQEGDAEEGLDILFAYREKEHAFSQQEKDVLITAIDEVKILDPACGSGAFPMGALQKLVYILSKLDPGDQLWKKRQLAKVDKVIEAAHDIDDTTFRDRAIADAEAQKKDIEEAFANNELGYGRKLYLIESCLYGVDIQPIATQVTKLRFFISLIVDQKVERQRENFGVRSLPNLETKFVTADSLIQLEKSGDQLDFSETPRISELKEKLKGVRHKMFSVKTPKTKEKYRKEEELLWSEIRNEVANNGWPESSADLLTSWKPYDQNASASYFDPGWMFGVNEGFDVVIGNPPYIQLQKDGGKLGDLYAALGFQTFVRSGDIYQLFYERACQLLADKHGLLCFITSNSWLKAKYGGKLRRYFCTQHTPLKLLEMGKDIFANAIVDTNILLLRNGKSGISAKAVDIDRLPDKNFPPQEKHWGELRPQGEGPWMVLSAIERGVMDKMETVGTRLNTWDTTINRGILTGYNEAFIINTATKDALIDADANSASILKPILRGRHVERYQAQWAGLWVIATFPSLRINIEDYPAIEQHLLSYGKDRLEQTGKTLSDGNKSRKRTPHQWFELQDTCAYHAEFEREKLFWMSMSPKGRFAYSDDGMYSNQKAFIMTGTSLKYLCAILNSSPTTWLMRNIAVTTGMELPQWDKFTVETIPIPKIPAAEQRPFIALIDRILTAKANNPTADTSTLEHEIDQHVYQLYQLTPDEIKTIESNQ